MKPLYLSPAVHSVLSEALRPGGLTLTRHLADLVSLQGKTIVDAGCGKGASLGLLQDYHPKFLVGVDVQQEMLGKAARQHATIQADMACMPIQKNSVDIVVAECAWNMSQQQAALEEFHRILSPGGILALSDIFCKTANTGEQWPLPCCFAAARTREEIEEMLTAAGFFIEYVADYSKLLKESAARCILQFGSLQQFWLAVCGNEHDAQKACLLGKTMLPGLFFLLARKTNSSCSC